MKRLTYKRFKMWAHSPVGFSLQQGSKFRPVTKYEFWIHHIYALQYGSIPLQLRPDTSVEKDIRDFARAYCNDYSITKIKDIRVVFSFALRYHYETEIGQILLGNTGDKYVNSFREK